MRKIIHVDMDAFYASVEQRDFPEYRGLPLAVGGGSPRGVVATASYEARKFGVRSAMPSAVARRLCPQLIFIKPRFDAYKEASHQIREIFRSYSELVEPLSLDEAYIDVTDPLKGPPSATLIARDIKAAILEQTKLTASAGVSYNKFLAKVASDFDKPDGLTVILPDEAEAFIAKLPVGKFHGIGPVTAARMESLGIQTGADLRERSEMELAELFGRAGRHYYRIVRGLDNRPVSPDRARKSVGAERTYFTDLDDPAEILQKVDDLAAEVAGRLARHHLEGRTVTLKIRYHDFDTHTRSRTLPHCVCTHQDLAAIGRMLLTEPDPPARPVRLLGLTVSSLLEPGAAAVTQLQLPF